MSFVLAEVPALGGALTIQQVFAEYNGPQLFTFTTQDGKLFFAYCGEEQGPYVEYYIAAINDVVLKRIMEGSMDYRDVWVNAIGPTRLLILDEDGAHLVDTKGVPSHLLHEPGVRFKGLPS